MQNSLACLNRIQLHPTVRLLLAGLLTGLPGRIYAAALMRITNLPQALPGVPTVTLAGSGEVT
jgi:hypothetical protein